jgi:predicted DNA-binding transcriptional regulator AlpA
MYSGKSNVKGGENKSMKANATARYLNEVQVSDMTGRALSTLRNERARNEGIPYIKIGRSVRYDLIDVIGFMDAHKIMTNCRMQQD